MNLLLSIFALLILLAWPLAAANKDLLVKISDGWLQGREVFTYGNQSGLVFLGIPIAKPPIGELRFRPPVINDPWDGVLSATQYRNACVADPTRTYKNDAGGPVDEDCLYLNVFTNRYCLQNQNCSVMAVIHGGRLTVESPASFKVEPIVNNFVGQDRNIVVVTLPYRLAILGWINISPEVKTFARPNLGIYDIERGFRWIQKEITNFGGDPKRVCAFGHSAGGQIIDLISMSPHFDDLFHSSVLMSAVNYIDYSQKTNSEASRRTCIMMGCAAESTNWSDKEEVIAVLNCLMSRPWKDFMETQMELGIRHIEDYTGATIDGYFFKTPFDDTMSTRKIRPILLGTVTAEFLETKAFEQADGLPDANELRRFCRNHMLGKGYNRPDVMIGLCERFYNRTHYTKQFFDDVAFYYPTATTAQSFLHPKNKVYVYSFSYSGIGDAYVAYQKDLSERPIHSEDFIYIFGMHRGNFTSKDYEIERIYTGMVADFVNGKNPAPEGYEWPEYEETRQQYFNIDFDEQLRLPGPKRGYYEEVVEFWNMIDVRSGGRSPLTYFPKGFDVYHEMFVVQGQAAHYKDKKRVDDPSLTGAEIAFYRWEYFFNTIEVVLKMGKLRDIHVTLTPEFGLKMEQTGALPIMMTSSIFLLAVAVFYIGCVKYYIFKKRSAYNEV